MVSGSELDGTDRVAEYEKPVDGLEGERSSLAYIQLEKHNERLKEALIRYATPPESRGNADGRMRDLSSDNEKESKSKISDLEKELSTLGDAQSRLELSEAKLANAETQVEDLKLQLDDALGAEDLLEQLTERNLQMSEVS
jgi:dynactin 1